MILVIKQEERYPSASQSTLITIFLSVPILSWKT
nr:MAG TPA: hypothetical protein [Caudoviricetes sp.]